MGRFGRWLDRWLPLSLKLTAPLVVASALWVVVGQLVIAMPTLRSELMRAEERRGLTIATFVEAAYEADPAPAALHAFLQGTVFREPSLLLVRIYRVIDGVPTLWATSASEGAVSPPADAGDVEPLRTGTTLQVFAARDGREVLETIVPIHVRGQPSATVGVYMLLDPLREATARMSSEVVVLALFMFAIQIVAILLVVHFVILRRIRLLDRAAARVAAGDLTVRLVDGDGAPTNDEIVRVARAFDQMTHAVAAQRVELERQAETDGLTGLLNRRALDVRLDLEVARAGRLAYPLALSIVDLDGFKAVNDSLGHPAGDEALRRIGGALAGAVRRIDIVARYGGDEFAVIHPGCDLDHAGAVATRVRRAVEALGVATGGAGGRRLTASVGTALLGTGGTVASLVADADQALYRAKRRGGGVEIAASTMP